MSKHALWEMRKSKVELALDKSVGTVAAAWGSSKVFESLTRISHHIGFLPDCCDESTSKSDLGLYFILQVRVCLQGSSHRSLEHH